MTSMSARLIASKSTRFGLPISAAGAVMGGSPETSVLNRHLQHRHVPDLWVVGAPAYPQHASHNPTATPLALTMWASDALIAHHLKPPGKILQT